MDDDLSELFEKAFPASQTPTLSPAAIRQVGQRRRVMQRVWIAVAVVVAIALTVGVGIVVANPANPNPVTSLDPRSSVRVPSSGEPSATVANPSATPSASSTVGKESKPTPTAGIPATAAPKPTGANAGVRAWPYSPARSTLDTDGLLPSADKLGWSPDNFTTLTVGGTGEEFCAGLNALGSRARLKAAVRSQDEGQLLIRVYSNEAADVIDAATKCHSDMSAKMAPRPDLNFGASAITWTADLPAGKWGTAAAAKGFFSVVRVGDASALIAKWAGTRVGTGASEESNFAAAANSVVAQLRSRVSQGWPLAVPGGVGPGTFFGPSAVAPVAGAWQEWMYDEEGSDPGEGFASGPKRSLIMTVNNVELAVHVRNAGSSTAACALVNDTLAAHKASGATYNRRTDFSIAKATEFQTGTFGGRPSAVVCTGNYAAVVTIRNSQNADVLMNAMSALAARLG